MSSLFSDGRESGPAPCRVSGALPAWLRGTLVRNGPGAFSGMSHLFDGLALLHAVRLRGDGEPPVYTSRFLASASFSEARARGGVPARREFGTDPSPRGAAGYVARARMLLCPATALGDNANVHIVRVGGALVALTESPAAW
jgi:carotenoid cleavage dioxygenase-like enzyme